ncbi:MAG: branched-chain amino acid ABC transporter permease [Candidatus Dormiibacterota bacterium]
MSEHQGPSALDPARPAAGAIRGSSAMLVAQSGLAPRPGHAGGVAGGIGPLVRPIYRWISTYFAGVMLALIVLAVGLTAVQHGATLMGEQIKNALVLGAMYALIAIGYTMVYGIIELINFAHGDVFTASGFYAFGFASVFHLDSLATGSFGGLLLALAIVFPLSMIAAGITGVVIEFVAYRRLRDAPRLAPLITAIGVSFLIEGIMLVVEGPDNVTTHEASWINGQAFMLGGVSVGYTDLFTIGMALLLMFALGTFVRRTRLGKAMRSTAQDRTAALLCGININRTISATFFIGSALAAAAAIIYSINYGVLKWNIGFHLGIIAFTAAVLGGIGNIVGAGVGGFIIGLIYVFGGSLFGGEWSEALIFAVLVLILTFRPVGLFGVEVTTRA